MENKIKVTVEYEKPETNKIDALMEQYAIASKIATQKTSEIRGVIKEVGRAKFLAIGEQLKEIGAKLRQLCLVGNKVYDPRIYVCYGYHRRFEIQYKYDNDYVYYLYGSSDCGSRLDNFFSEGNYQYLVRDTGLVTNWNEYDIINKLNEELEKKIISETKSQFSNIRIAENHLETMLK